MKNSFVFRWFNRPRLNRNIDLFSYARHQSRLTNRFKTCGCRVKYWRSGNRLKLVFPRFSPFPLRVSQYLSHTLFPAPSRQTVREVFPHTAFLLPSQQGIIHLSTWSCFQDEVLYSIVIVQSPFLVYLLPTPQLPAKALPFLPLHNKPSHLLLNVISDFAKALLLLPILK